jgi:hypothetical protein
MTDYSDEQKLACTEREIKKRRQVYPGLILTGRMSEEKAHYEIEVMQAIAEDYRKLAEKERLL